MEPKWRPISSKKLEEELKKIDKYIKEGSLVPCITLKENNFSINWEEIVKLSNCGNNFASEMLEELGILDYFSKGNYAVIWDNRNANPFGLGFFKEKEDAEAYKETIICEYIKNNQKEFQDFMDYLAAFGVKESERNESRFRKFMFSNGEINIVQYLD